MSKYTPGPWQVCEEKSSVHSPIADKIVHSAEMNINPALGPQTYEEECANARLIAAAPEMLEALYYIERLLAQTTWDYRSDGKISRIISTIIAKAEGPEDPKEAA